MQTHGPVTSPRRIRFAIAAAAAFTIAALVHPAAAQDPRHTATIYVPGYDSNGADRSGVFGMDRNEPLVDSVAALIGAPVAAGEAALPHDVVATATYYGDTAPAYYSAGDLAELSAVTAQWGGAVPRYAAIVAKYARDVMQRAGVERVNFVSGSFGALIVRWLIEKDVGG